ncbi:protein WHAT'S THIS FACTOR 9, mitochondrial [Magnolia sinica]|uniref:protein WHAT'S THIS FACTOR 9, mitochondrial n=1 Tax=Magnolia sinica TaxID=86752 RepID=UPI002658E176|nr:protein WHAT'S THIS FACTOR 9, mitochondrial [Magnolia sinica]
MLSSLRTNLHRLPPPSLILQSASFLDGARIRWIRDRGLDHAVEKEKNLIPVISLINLILSEPSNSLPLSVASDMKPQLSLPTRAIDFIRKYPSIFLELPSTSPPYRPRIAVTPDALHLHDDLDSAVRSSRDDSADRLVKLLMLSPQKKLPIWAVDRLRWDLGLPDDYARSVLPEFPDYFQVSPFRPGEDNRLALELVCWSKELAVSAMEKAARSKGEYKKGMPLAFPLQFSRGFDLEKKVKKWVDEWQRLPYISPYEDGTHLPPKSDIGEKWAVGVLHEILHLLVPKKTDKENVFLLGEVMGLRSRFKRALSDHPGIFYVSNKIRTSTVVLREAYKRDLLVQKHPLMGMRYQFIHLMNKGKDGRAAGPLSSSHANSNKNAWVEEEEDDDDNDNDYDDGDDESGEEDSEEEGYGDSDSESEDESEGEDGEDEVGPRQGILVGRRETRRVGQRPIEMTRPAARTSIRGRSSEKRHDTVGKVPRTFSRRTETQGGHNVGVRSQGRQNYPRSGGERRSSDRRTPTF